GALISSCHENGKITRITAVDQDCEQLVFVQPTAASTPSPRSAYFSFPVAAWPHSSRACRSRKKFN
ncbi:hypothetical protein PMIN03_011492, partial [Paraphaeosphaeria minitans]